MSTLTAADLVAQTEWSRRDPEFRQLGIAKGVSPSDVRVVMAFSPVTEQMTPMWPLIKRRWTELPRDPAILAPGAQLPGDEIWLEYAALDWDAPRYSDAVPDQRTQIARWGMQLAQAFSVVMTAPQPDWRALARFYVGVDIGLHVRLGFLPSNEASGIWIDDEPNDARAWVRAVAVTLRELATFGSSALADIVARCEDKRRRYQSLDVVREAFARLAGSHFLRQHHHGRAWQCTEQGLGWLTLNAPERAHDEFQTACSLARSPLVDWGLATALKRGGGEGPEAELDNENAETPAWVQRARWDKRSPAFEALTIGTESPPRPIMELLGADVHPSWPDLLTAWQQLPSHPNLLQPARDETSSRWLHFAAFDWEWEPVDDDPRLHGWAIQLAGVFKLIVTTLGPPAWSRFAKPLVHVDIGGHVRVGFLPTPPSALRFTERDFVAIVGQALVQLCPNHKTEAGLAQRIARCIDPDPAGRYESLDALSAAFSPWVRASGTVRSAIRKTVWWHAERGLALVFLERFQEALEAFHEANRINPIPLSQWGARYCKGKLKLLPVYTELSGLAPDLWWSEAKERIGALVKERAFREAIELYDRVRLTEDNRLEVHSGRARCHLEARDPANAIEYARKVRSVEPGRMDMLAIIIRAQIEGRLHADALAGADLYIGAATHDALAHYLRGKALIGLGRLEEARDAFDLAIALRPTMVEAMLLRREADRSLLKGGRTVGSQHVTLSLPAHLENLRDVLASGRSKAIIEALSTPSLADDPDAQLMLARFFGFADRLDDAIAIYDRWIDSPHRLPALIGKAGALLDQGRIESALSLFDIAVAEKPNDADACEGRARTLDTLGRTAEAAAEFRRFVSLAAGGANLRVRVAQLWLDRH